MLKFLLAVILLMEFSSDWTAIQLGLAMLSALVGLMCFHNLHLYSLGFELGLDFVSYIMVYLSVWTMFLVIIPSQQVKSKMSFLTYF